MEKFITGKGLYFFYALFILILGLTFYISGFYKKEKILSTIYRVKRFGNEHRYAIEITEDLNIELRKVEFVEGKAYIVK